MPTHRPESPSARDEIADYLDRLTERLAAHLGEHLMAAWMVGSGALGDFDRDRSDVDVQAVSSVRHSGAELRRLASALSHDALPCPVRGLEFVLYAREDLNDPAGPAFQLNLNSGRGIRRHEGLDPRSEPRFWFTLDIAIARDNALPLTGAVPATVLPVLPRPLILHALSEALDWHGLNDVTQAVLAACRAWAWAADGSWLSKGGAATWAIARLPDPRPVVKALENRGDPRKAGPSPAEAAAFLRVVRATLERVERMATPSPGGADALTIRFARASERPALEALQRRSSMHQPMYRAQLAAHPDAIALPAEQIAARLVRVAELNGAVVGFAALLERSADACELDALFVEPEQMRAGVGRRLVADAERIARERGARRIDVIANPQALAFYEAVGFVTVGEAQTRFGSAPRLSLAIA